jgi:hypothetical protein
VAASEIKETDSIGEVARHVEKLAEKHGPKNVLLVCDLDNTLLAMNQGLGGVAWFDWQARLLKENPKSKELVATDFGGLLRVQTLLFALGRMHRVEHRNAEMIRDLQKRGVRTLILTSRGPACRDSTEAALRDNRLDFARKAPSVKGGFPKKGLPYDPNDTSAAGITPEEAKRFGLGKPRPASYANGVFMTSGQHKGAMLLALLAHCPRRFSAIVFVDDKKKHAEEVVDALRPRGIEIVAYRYAREDGAVRAFKKTGWKKADRQWKLLRKVLDSIFQ